MSTTQELELQIHNLQKQVAEYRKAIAFIKAERDKRYKAERTTTLYKPEGEEE